MLIENIGKDDNVIVLTTFEEFRQFIFFKEIHDLNCMIYNIIDESMLLPIEENNNLIHLCPLDSVK